MSSERDSSDNYVFIHVPGPAADVADKWFASLSRERSRWWLRVCSAADDFGIMMDGRGESREQESVYTARPYISIHLPLIQRRWRQRRRAQALGRFVDVPANPRWFIMWSQRSNPNMSPFGCALSFFIFPVFISCIDALLSFLFPSCFSFFLPSCYYFLSAAATLHPPPSSLLGGRHPSLKCCTNFQSTCSRVRLKHGSMQLASASAGKKKKTKKTPTTKLGKSSGSWSMNPVTWRAFNLI